MEVRTPRTGRIVPRPNCQLQKRSRVYALLLWSSCSVPGVFWKKGCRERVWGPGPFTASHWSRYARHKGSSLRRVRFPMSQIQLHAKLALFGDPTYKAFYVVKVCPSQQRPVMSILCLFLHPKSRSPLKSLLIKKENHLCGCINGNSPYASCSFCLVAFTRLHLVNA